MNTASAEFWGARLNMKSIKTEEGSRHSRFRLVVLQSKKLYVPGLI